MPTRRYIQMLGILMFLVGMPGRTMDEKIGDVWQRIQQARDGKIDKPESLPPAATEEQIRYLAKTLDCQIPDQLHESLLVHNGSGESGLEIVNSDDTWQSYRALSIDGIIQHWQKDRQRESEAIAEGDPFPKKPEWIPVFLEPAEHQEQIYLDTTDGTILHFNSACGWGDEVDEFRYPDYLTFLKVLEHHIRNDLWFEWGNGLDAKAWVPPLQLDESGIKQLKAKSRHSVSIKLSNGRIVTVADEKESELVDSILAALAPAKFIRTPAVEAPDYEVSFKVGKAEYRIGIKKGPKELLSYSINTANTQITGGDPAKLTQILDAITPR